MKRTIRRLLSAVLTAAMAVTVAAVPLDGLLAEVFAAQPTDYVVIDDCDSTTYYSNATVDNKEKMQGTASLGMSVSGTTTVQNVIGMNKPISADVLDNYYLELWMYVDAPSKIVLNDSAIGVFQDMGNTAEVRFSKLGTLKKGWNKVQVKLSNFALSGDRFNTLNRVYFKIRTNGTIQFRWDDICLIAAPKADDTSALQEAVDAGNVLAKEDLSGYATANVQAFRNALTIASNRLTAGCSQRDADVATLNLKAAMNAFGMEGLEEDASASVAYIDFSTKKYNNIARYAIRQADGKPGKITEEELAGKTAAAFSGELLLAVDEGYVSSKDSTLRVTYTYYDGEAGSLALAYNSNGNPAKDAGSAKLNGSGSWQRRSVKVTDAELTEAIDGRYDLKIALSGAELAYIARVEVKRVTEDDVTEKDAPQFAPMTDVNNFKDKSVAGYQMWFTANSGNGGWVHWASGNIPSNDRVSFEMWPDTSEYPSSVLEKTAFKNLGDGRAAELFTSVREETVDLHVSWMQESGLDGFAIQRFYGAYLGEHAADNLKLAATAAEKYDRVFYVMYDLNGAYGAGNQAAEVLKSDFVRNVEQTGVISSTSYAQMDGRPVVCMWGLDPTSESYANHDASMEFICWLQDRGYYVIGGTSNNTWYDGENAFTDVYRQLDMLSPWTVGRYGYNNVFAWMKKNVEPALKVCEEFNIAYQPVVLAGSAWHNHNWGYPNDQPRLAGNFLWRQVYALKNLYKCERVYFAMFDEYDEATAITKAAQDSYDIPEDEQYFSTLSVDGTWLSSDYYLRLAGTICDLMRRDEEIAERPNVAHSQGPIYWRNSFEKRWTYVREEDKTSTTGRRTVKVTLAPLEVCLPYIQLWDGGYSTELKMKTYECAATVDYVEGDTSYKAYGTNTVGTGLHNDPTKTRTSNGTWSLQFNGTSAGGSDAYCVYSIAETDIMISTAGLEFSYDTLADNDLGRSVYMDLVLNVDGRQCLLSDYTKDVKTSVSSTGKWISRRVTLPASLVGQKIAYVLVGYSNTAAGEFNAYLDNVLIKSPGSEKEMLQTSVDAASRLDSDSKELAAAIRDGQAVLKNSDAGNKTRLAAVKAIDNALRNAKIASPSVTYGDVNGDGAVDTADAVLVLQRAAELIDDSAIVVEAADVNGDGAIDTADAVLILQKAAELIENFPVEQ